ncbi:MAG: hypothetical protein CMF46_05700 [Legionellales bacterium]|nr:hypothetical protein [Legionellales bacterium]|tara:strand:- start:700 stop:918 length:219 start_codon:yes stop_codon:yes gene_type:complete
MKYIASIKNIAELVAAASLVLVLFLLSLLMTLKWLHPAHKAITGNESPRQAFVRKNTTPNTHHQLHYDLDNA